MAELRNRLCATQSHIVGFHQHSNEHHRADSPDEIMTILWTPKIVHKNDWITNRKSSQYLFRNQLKRKYIDDAHLMRTPCVLTPIHFRFESPYRSTCNIPNSLSIRKYSNYSNPATPDSPRSTRSAPWSRSQQKGLFGVSSSPRSVRSATSRKSSNVPTHRLRSSSVESHSSNESKAGKR